MPFIIFIVFIAGMYLLLLRPQQQRVRRQRELIMAIDVGDQIVTAGGLIGRVVGLNDERLLLEVADGVQIELLRLAISRKLDDSDFSNFAGDEAEAESESEVVESAAPAPEPTPAPTPTPIPPGTSVPGATGAAPPLPLAPIPAVAPAPPTAPAPPASNPAAPAPSTSPAPIPPGPTPSGTGQDQH